MQNPKDSQCAYDTYYAMHVTKSVRSKLRLLNWPPQINPQTRVFCPKWRDYLGAGLLTMCRRLWGQMCHFDEKSSGETHNGYKALIFLSLQVYRYRGISGRIARLD